MNQHIGVDIVEIGRIRQAIARWGDAFRKRVFTGAELAGYGASPQSLAARFAGKEAAFKALGKPAGISWRDIEILADANGQPVINLYGKARQRAESLGLDGLVISLAHSREQAIAFVSGQSNK